MSLRESLTDRPNHQNPILEPRSSKTPKEHKRLLLTNAGSLTHHNHPSREQNQAENASLSQKRAKKKLALIRRRMMLKRVARRTQGMFQDLSIEGIQKKDPKVKKLKIFTKKKKSDFLQKRLKFMEKLHVASVERSILAKTGFSKNSALYRTLSEYTQLTNPGGSKPTGNRLKRTYLVDKGTSGRTSTAEITILDRKIGSMKLNRTADFEVLKAAMGRGKAKSGLNGSIDALYGAGRLNKIFGDEKFETGNNPDSRRFKKLWQSLDHKNRYQGVTESEIVYFKDGKIEKVAKPKSKRLRRYKQNSSKQSTKETHRVPTRRRRSPRRTQKAEKSQSQKNSKNVAKISPKRVNTSAEFYKRRYRSIQKYGKPKFELNHHHRSETLSLSKTPVSIKYNSQLINPDVPSPEKRPESPQKYLTEPQNPRNKLLPKIKYKGLSGHLKAFQARSFSEVNYYMTDLRNFYFSGISKKNSIRYKEHFKGIFEAVRDMGRLAPVSYAEVESRRVDLMGHFDSIEEFNRTNFLVLDLDETLIRAQVAMNWHSKAAGGNVVEVLGYNGDSIYVIFGIFLTLF